MKRFRLSRPCQTIAGTGLVLLVVVTGCSRTNYRLRADRDAYGILHEKADATPWTPPYDYSVYPSPASRLHHQSPVDDPCLPTPSPQLYAYDLPDIPDRDAARFNPTQHPGDAGLQTEVPDQQPPSEDAPRLPPVPKDLSYESAAGSPDSSDPFHFASFQTPAPEIAIQPATGPDDAVRNEPAEDVGNATDDDLIGVDEDTSLDDVSLTRQRAPIPPRYWNSIPSDCLKRMLEFESISSEFGATFENAKLSDQLDDSPRLALEDVIELAVLNSRELQTEKEILYSVAIGLTLDRFQYQLKPSVGNNGTAVDYSHDRSGGETINSLGIPTTLQLDKMLWTGGDILARFANSVVLTFNGPQGFAADVGSELFFEITQSLLQRDVRLESLTQAERDVVYAARDYGRFRKEFFVDLASQYYSLIRQFRQIEIDSQNYFTLVRNFNQGAAEFRAGLTSRIELDQIEQQVINGRRGLLSSCTSLENSLDDLKLRIGLPTEEPINLDLTELNLLTLRDEIAVNAELVSRARGRVQTELRAEFPGRATLLSSAIVLLDRMLESIRLRDRLDQQTPDAEALEKLLSRLQVEASGLEVEEARVELDSELNDESPSLPVVFQRRMDVVSELLRLVGFQLELAARLSESDRVESDQAEPDQALENQQYARLRSDAIQLNRQFAQLVAEERLDDIPQLVNDSEKVQTDIESLSDSIAQSVDMQREELDPETELRRTVTEVTRLLDESESFLISSVGGLVPIDIGMDDAMMTALVQRFDLVNERGILADDWRAIKLASTLR